MKARIFRNRTPAHRACFSNSLSADELAQRLLEKEVIFKDDLEKIFGQRPFEKNAEPADSSEVVLQQPIEEPSTEGEH